MAEETNNKEINPVCPHCGKDPVSFRAKGPINLGPFIFMVIFCDNLECRKIFNVNMMGTRDPRMVG